jgi:hypothetical protein
MQEEAVDISMLCLEDLKFLLLTKKIYVTTMYIYPEPAELVVMVLHGLITLSCVSKKPCCSRDRRRGANDVAAPGPEANESPTEDNVGINPEDEGHREDLVSDQMLQNLLLLMRI